MMPLPVGVLALQGDFDKHQQALERAGRESLPVRRPDELARVGALVIPGGESTTLSRLIDRGGMRMPLIQFANEGRPVLGTCAGLIMLSSGLVGERFDHWHGVQPLGLLDVQVQRNGFGRQVDSFTETLDLHDDLHTADRAEAVYIRAPRIVTVGDRATVLATRPDGEVVGVRQGSVVGLTFHPELGDDPRFHELLT